MIFSINYIVKLYITPTMSTPSTMKYKPTFSARKPVKDVTGVSTENDIILYHQSQPRKNANHPLQGALSATNILFSTSGGRPCSVKRRL